MIYTPVRAIKYRKGLGEDEQIGLEKDRVKGAKIETARKLLRIDVSVEQIAITDFAINESKAL